MTSLLSRIIQMSISAGYVIVLVMLIRILFRRLPRKYSYFLWSAVGFRLLCPVSFSSKMSLFNLRFTRTDSRLVDLTEVTSISELGTDLHFDTGIPSVSQAIEKTFSGSTLPDVSSGGISTVPVKSISVCSQIAVIVWAIGFMIMLGYGLVSYIIVNRKMAYSLPLRNNIRQAHTKYAFILGILKPRIYIPFDIDPDIERIVISHEEAHLARKDHLIRLLSFILLSCHWFNPMCWVAYYEMEKDMEMSCDEIVLDHNHDMSAAYSAALLSFSAGKHLSPVTPLAFGERNVRERIINAMKHRKTTKALSAIACLICIATLVACGTNSMNAQPITEDSVQEETNTNDNNSARIEEITEKMNTLKDELERIRKEIEEKKASTVELDVPGEHAMIVPLKGSFIMISRGFNQDYHRGIDLVANNRTEVYAAYEGIVRSTGYLNDFGNYVILEHGGKIMTMYSHLDSFSVSSGDHVMQGDTIGYSGASGNATGPHLDFRVIIDGKTEVDPAPYLDKQVEDILNEQSP